MDITWKDYKELVSSHIENGNEFIYRGQRDSKWPLKPSLLRTEFVKSHEDFKQYFNSVIPLVQDPVEAWLGKEWDLSSQLGLAEFLAFLQHNGFPTPLLDWSYSPYVAAYFAFESINHFFPQNDKVAIYTFNQLSWRKKYKQEYDITHDKNHVSILNPRAIGNHKLALQQGCFTFTNVINIEEHIKEHEEKEGEFLNTYHLDVKERPKVIKELSLMGVSPIQLIPSIESVCKKALDDLIGLHPVGSPQKN